MSCTVVFKYSSINIFSMFKQLLLVVFCVACHVPCSRIYSNLAEYNILLRSRVYYFVYCVVHKMFPRYLLIVRS